MLAILGFACTGCASRGTSTTNQPTAFVAEVQPTVTATPETIRVLPVMPVTQATRNDEYYLDNCSSSTPVTRSLAEGAAVQMSVTISDQATQVGGSLTAPISAEMKDRLATEVEAAYQEALDAARAAVSETILFTDAHARNYITIVWEERVYAATVCFSINGVAYVAEYTYTLEVPRAGSVKPGICTL